MFTLNMRTANAAFEADGEEVARILEECARKVRRGETAGLLMDVNGNRVGKWNLREREGRP